jgi:hypothetical protein
MGTPDNITDSSTGGRTVARLKRLTDSSTGLQAAGSAGIRQNWPAGRRNRRVFLSHRSV